MDKILVGQRVKVKPLLQLKESIHNRVGTVVEVGATHTSNATGEQYYCLSVELDKPANLDSKVDGVYWVRTVYLPDDCFEALN